MKQVYLISAAVVLTGLYSCKNNTNKEGAALVASSGIELANLDSTVNPQEDFFQFSNGNWLKNNPIPSSESSWGSFNQLRDENNKALRTIVEGLAADNSI